MIKIGQKRGERSELYNVRSSVIESGPRMSVTQSHDPT